MTFTNEISLLIEKQTQTTLPFYVVCRHYVLKADMWPIVCDTKLVL